MGTPITYRQTPGDGWSQIGSLIPGTPDPFNPSKTITTPTPVYARALNKIEEGIMADTTNNPTPRYGDKIKVTSRNGGSYTGWYFGRLSDTVDTYKSHLMVILDNNSRETFYVNPTWTWEIIDTGGPVPPEVRTIGDYFVAYNTQKSHVDEARSGRTKALRDLDAKQVELDTLNDKIRKAFQTADEKGYCSEVQTIAAAAELEIPAKPKQSVPVQVTLTVYIEKEAWTLDAARKMVRQADVRAKIRDTDGFAGITLTQFDPDFLKY